MAPISFGKERAMSIFKTCKLCGKVSFMSKVYRCPSCGYTDKTETVSDISSEQCIDVNRVHIDRIKASAIRLTKFGYSVEEAAEIISNIGKSRLSPEHK